MIKDDCRDIFKAEASILTSNQDFKPFNKSKKDKKKKKNKLKWDSTTLAIKVNTAEIDDKKKKKRDISKIMYSNYNKKKQYITKFPES